MRDMKWETKVASTNMHSWHKEQLGRNGKRFGQRIVIVEEQRSWPTV